MPVPACAAAIVRYVSYIVVKLGAAGAEFQRLLPGCHRCLVTHVAGADLVVLIGAVPLPLAHATVILVVGLAVLASCSSANEKPQRLRKIKLRALNTSATGLEK